MTTTQAKRTAIREIFIRAYNELATEINKSTRNLTEIQRLQKQLENRFLAINKVDDEFEFYLQEKETTEAEYMALSSTVQEALWLSQFENQFNFNVQRNPIKIQPRHSSSSLLAPNRRSAGCAGLKPPRKRKSAR